MLQESFNTLSGVNMISMNIFSKTSGFRMTNHALERSQQRCIPPLIIHWLCRYSAKVILLGSASLWCFATRLSTPTMAIVLVKCCNAVAGHHSDARRVDLSAPMAALRPLRRTMAIHCETCLAMNADRPTEPNNITLAEYSYGSRKRSNNGTIVCYFDRKSLRLISSDVGQIIIRRLSGLMNAYLVIAGDQILTVGHRYKRIKNF
jgi:hypothetical protein